MISTRTLATSGVASRQGSQQLAKAVFTFAAKPQAASAIRYGYAVIGVQTPSRRQFSSTSRTQMKEFFPAPDAPHIKVTPAAWPHPVYTEDQMNSVVVAHRNAKTWTDWSALTACRLFRKCLDIATGYKHDKAVALGNKDPKAAQQKYGMTEKKYMIRNVFLESIAGVPGMVAATLRHLHSMRRMKRDNGWIETLLEESYNERMHLLIFLKMAEPGWFMRMMVLGAQGVFYNGFFLTYLISPRTAHRFVGYIEEEAVITYTREIADLDAGKLPNWAKMQAPDIAVQYYNMPEGKRTMRDVLLYIRADESKHREVNHTLANLDQESDPNPYASEYKDDSKPHPDKGIRFPKPTGWERGEAI